MSKPKLIRRRRPISDVNVVPYIDVMLVLLVVFMVTAPMLSQGVNVDLPEADAKPLSLNQNDEVIVVSVDAQETYYLSVGGDPKQSRTLGEITGTVSKVIKNKPRTPVLVKGDTLVPYGFMVKLMVALEKAGASNLGLVTEPFGKK